MEPWPNQWLTRACNLRLNQSKSDSHSQRNGHSKTRVAARASAVTKADADCMRPAKGQEDGETASAT
eukprot:361921-Chlamydomonas_euryale.AAC.16